MEINWKVVAIMFIVLLAAAFLYYEVYPRIWKVAYEEGYDRAILNMAIEQTQSGNILVWNNTDVVVKNIQELCG